MDPQISLPGDLKSKVERAASARGISPDQFVRDSLERAVARDSADDPLFNDTAVHRDDGPDDLATNHDDYLYRDAS